MTDADMCRIGRLVVLWGKSDEELAFVLGLSMAELAEKALRSEAFYNAITPTQQDRKDYADRVAERRAKRNARTRAATAGNPSQRIRKSVAARMWAALKGIRRDPGLFSRLPYGCDELMAHLESRFSAGMSWENYGKWHIDHKKPCSLFNLSDPSEFEACWSLDNLQPLWAEDNIRKGARYAGA